MSSKFTNSQPTIELKVNSPTANVGITDAEYNISLNPDVEADIFATKAELSAVENKIPAEYVKSAAVADNKLTLTKQDNTVVEFEGGGGSYTLPVASTTTLGGVKPDETTTTVDEDGTIHAHDTTPVATTTTVGSVKPDGTTITIDSNGVITANIPTKTSDLTNDSDFITTEYHDSTKQNVLIPGNNITISANNVISATGGGSGGGSYTLPVASTTALGGVMVGSIGPLNKGRYVSAEENGRLYVAPPDVSSMYPGVVYPGSGLELYGSRITLEPPIKGANDKYSIGGVKPDETTTTVDDDGTIHAHDTTPVATTTTVGSVKPDGTTITIDSNGVISSQTAGAIYKTLPKDTLGDYLKNPVNKAWVIDWVNNPDKYIVDINGSKVIRTVKVSSIFYYYYFSSSDNTISFYYINFTDNNFTEISSNQPSWSMSDVYLLTNENWQNYINLSGGDWENTTDTSDYHFYNAKEVVIFWTDTQAGNHQTYLNVGCDRWGNYGSTWGNSWANTDIYLDKWDEYNGAYINYDGNSVNATNCSISAICYKT